MTSQHRTTNKTFLSHFADDTAQWAFSLNVHIAAKRLQQDLLKLTMWFAKWRIKLNPKKKQVDYILQVHTRQKNRTQPKTIWRDTKNLSSSEIFGVTFDFQLNFKKHFEDILDRCNTRYHHLRLLVNNNGDLAHPPSYKFTNSASDQCLNTVLFQQLPPQTISSAKFSGSKASLSGLPYIYQNTFVLSCSMTRMAFHM